VYRVRTREPLVGLSFDDGPHPAGTPQVLEILARHRATATFFLIGERAERHPDLVARIKAEGHEVANHHLADRTTLTQSESAFLDGLDRTERALGLGPGRKLFRPPGGLARPGQLALARSRGYICVLGSAYPHDPLHPPVSYIRWLVSKNLEAGAIVILHDGITDPSRTVAALPGVLAAGREEGLRFVTVGSLLRAAEPRAAAPR
jgi:peptidoglycan/xylan/chitin deacetylase (PgdA/CDA1 family)